MMKYIAQTIEAHGVSVEETRYEPEYPELYSQKIACFTGHRKIPDITKQINIAIDLALDMGINHFFVGMALGSDQLAAKVLMSRNLPWTAVIPCANQSELWSLQHRKESDRLLRYAENQVIIKPNYTADCMHIRNKYMIDHSDVCIAIYDGRFTGGAFKTYCMAVKKFMPVIKVHPKTKEVSIYQPPKPNHTQFSLF